MTREQAKREIDNIDFYLQHHTDDYSERSHDAMMMAISALEQQCPYYVKDDDGHRVCKNHRYMDEPCEDAVSRKDVIKAIDKWITEYKPQHYLIQSIRELPSVTQKSGKWHIAHGWYEDRFWCSCGYIRIMDSRMNEWKYCPVCGGAKMVEPQESEDKNE